MNAVTQRSMRPYVYGGQLLVASLVSVRAAIWFGKRGTAQPATGSVILKAAAVPPSEEDLKWAKRLDDITFDALPNTRAAAAKWAATITAVTGVFSIFALVKGRDDLTKLSQGWEIAAGVLVLLATFLALRAIILAALAAEGTPTDVVVDASNVKQFYRDATVVAGWQLIASRVTAVLAVLVVSVAIGVSWFAPVGAASPQLRLVSLTSGKTLCGSLSVNTDGTLKLTAPDTTTLRESLASGDISRIDDTTACTS